MSTYIAVILDESGSMGIKRSDVLGGFNTFLEEQRAVQEQARMLLVKFNTVYQTVCTDRPLAEVQPLTEKTYVPGGNTALFDAIAHSIRLAEQGATKDDRVLCLIITDGEENSSKETTFDQVKDLIAAKEKTGVWTFVYLGAAPSAFAHGMHISPLNVKRYDQDNPSQSISTMSHHVTQYRVSSEKMSKDFWSNRK